MTRRPGARLLRSVLVIVGLVTSCGRGAMQARTIVDGGNSQVDMQWPDIAQGAPDAPVLPDTPANRGTSDAPVLPDTPADRGTSDRLPEISRGTCGNGRREPDEQCDDGNKISGDGCSSTCALECGDAGLGLCIDPCFGDCTMVCCATPVTISRCGDGRRTGGEACDDGNADAGDGCSDACQVEPGYVCYRPGAACIPVCGDRMVKTGETCDDGNIDDGDGCSRFCLTEPGWACDSGVCVRLPAVDGGSKDGPVPLFCGDGVRSGAEQCDDGPGNSDEVYPGCNTRCAYVYCGDGAVNGDEECDDGERNGATYGQHGCTAGCRRAHFCGDNMIDTLFGEECDLGDLNGRTLDGKLRPSTSPEAMVYCKADCTFSLVLP